MSWAKGADAGRHCLNRSMVSAAVRGSTAQHRHCSKKGGVVGLSCGVVNSKTIDSEIFRQRITSLLIHQRREYASYLGRPDSRGFWRAIETEALITGRLFSHWAAINQSLITVFFFDSSSIMNS